MCTNRLKSQGSNAATAKCQPWCNDNAECVPLVCEEGKDGENRCVCLSHENPGPQDLLLEALLVDLLYHVSPIVCIEFSGLIHRPGKRA